MLCRFTLIPDGNVPIYRGQSGDTYETALLSSGFNPDAALVFCLGRSLPQDKKSKKKRSASS